MKNTLLILLTVMISFGCNNQPQEKGDSMESYFIILKTIPNEIGLENYTPNAKELTGEIVKQLKGSDGDEYYLMQLDNLLEYRAEHVDLTTNYLIVGGKYLNRPLVKGANKTIVNVAIVRDVSLIDEAELNFEKAIFAGMGEATELKRLKTKLPKE